MAKQITIKGLDQAISKLKALPEGLPRSLANILNSEHETIMGIAKLRTPVDTGTLRASGTVLPPEIKQSRIESIGTFGGAAAPYAIHVHERLDLSHTVGQAKFYESAAAEQEPELKAAVIKTIRGYLRMKT